MQFSSDAVSIAKGTAPVAAQPATLSDGYMAWGIPGPQAGRTGYWEDRVAPV